MLVYEMGLATCNSGDSMAFITRAIRFGGTPDFRGKQIQVLAGVLSPEFAYHQVCI
jgi:hypothetical protein